jgi:hypothetical protein
MKTQVLFVQGGGKNAHEEDQKLAASLQAALGSDYNVLFPRMPKESDPEYWRWKTDIARRIARLGVADLVLVRSHSLIVRTHLLILVALLVVPLFCAISYIREFIAVDSALDSGASYDYVAGRADYRTNHVFIPFSHRHRSLIVSSGVLLAAAVVYGSFAISGRLRSRAI